MKTTKWINSTMCACLMLGAMAVQAADSADSQASETAVVGTITNIDGMVYTIKDLRGTSHTLELHKEGTTWGSAAVGSEVKAVVDSEQISELITLDD